MDPATSIHVHTPFVSDKGAYILGYQWSKSDIEIGRFDDTAMSPGTGAATPSMDSGEDLEESVLWKSLENEISRLNLNGATVGLGNLDLPDPVLCPTSQRSEDYMPIQVLDFVRYNQRDDFRTNGIDMDLDEYDLKLYEDRHNRTREASFPGHVQESSLVPLESCLFSDGKEKAKKGRKSTKNTVCVFCKNNGEPLSVYGTHLLKDAGGRVSCPILRRYTCPICGSSGDSSHTIKYCPLNETSPSSCVSLLKTPRNANGRKRHN